MSIIVVRPEYLQGKWVGWSVATTESLSPGTQLTELGDSPISAAPADRELKAPVPGFPGDAPQDLAALAEGLRRVLANVRRLLAPTARPIRAGLPDSAPKIVSVDPRMYAMAGAAAQLAIRGAHAWFDHHRIVEAPEQLPDSDDAAELERRLSALVRFAGKAAMPPAQQANTPPKAVHNADFTMVTGPHLARPPSKVALALATLAEHPEWTNQQIASAVGCNAKYLSQSTKFRTARMAVRAIGKESLNRDARHRGTDMDTYGETEG